MPEPGRIEAYDYNLPQELIATRPAPARDGARMLVIHRSTGRIEHARFRDLSGFLKEGDLVVLNNSRVIRARLRSEGCEIFLVERAGPSRWRCLVKPGRKFRPGDRGQLADTAFVVEQVEADGCRLIAFEREPDLARHGEVPLPPYMHRRADEQDSVRYQTVFASEDGSVAAPTAGLHFTKELLARIPHAFITLHAGIGTFLPVKTSNLSDHHMHSERFHISQETAARINAANRILAVGTTSVRVLESQPEGPIQPGSGSTDLFIRPPFTFHHTGALLTNFHLPKSTLLVLVCAFAGTDLTLEAYRQAVQERYRFYSYGDCMLIL